MSKQKNVPFERSLSSCKYNGIFSEKNNTDPKNIFKGSVRKYIFVCGKCDHEFHMRPNDVTNNHWCPYCSPTCQKLCDDEKCQLCFERSFASCKFSKYLSDKNNISARKISKYSDKKYFFNCTCGHEVSGTPHLISRDETKTFCGYCSSRKLCDDRNCQPCFNKSFASHNMAKYFSTKNKVTARQIFKGTHELFLFNCECGHEFEMSINNVTNNHWCPYCCKPSQKLCTDLNCKLCLNNSFASSELLPYFCEENNVDPRFISKHSENKYIFLCDVCSNKFKCSLSNIGQNTWCPICKNKTEKKLFEYLKIKHDLVTTQFKQIWCKNDDTKRQFPFDFVFDNIIIELDGGQHFFQVRDWKTPEETRARDVYKMKCANEHEYSVIRILQNDVFKDTYDWKNELELNIQKIITDKFIQNIYMCKNNEYEPYIIDMK